MSLLDCFDRAQRMGVISAEEASNLKSRWRQISADTVNTAEARARMQREIEAEAQQRERAALLTEVKRTSIMEALRAHRNHLGQADMLEAWVAMHENFGRIGGFIQDAEGLRMTIANQAQADLRQVLTELKRGALTGDLRRTSGWVGSAKVQARMDAFVRELFGEATGDATAAMMARAWEKVSEDLRVRFNAAGGAIGKLDKWGMSQSHNPLALLDFGRDAWVEYMMGDGVLDRNRTVNQLTGERLSDADLRRALKTIWDRITTDGYSDADISAVPKGRGAVYTQHADHRFLHFKDGRAWLDYARRFGNPDPFATMMSHIAVMSRDIAHMETFGPNPNALRGWMSEWLKGQAARQRPQDVVRAELISRLRDIGADVVRRPDDYQSTLDDLSRALDALDERDRSAGPNAMAAARSQLEQILIDEGQPDLLRRINAVWDEMPEAIVVKEGVDSRRIIDLTKKRLARADGMWRLMRGVEPESRRFAENMQSVRNFITATSLGGAWISSLSDPAFGQDARMRIGMGFAKANFGRLMVATLRDMITMGSREDAIDAMLGLDSAMSVLTQKAAEVRGVDHKFWSSWIADRTLTWGLLSPWTQAGKHLAGRDLMTFLGSHATTGWNQLPEGLRRALATHGFDGRSWDTIRTVDLFEGRRLRPNEILAVDRQLGERYLQMILREVRYSVPEGGVQSRSVINSAAAGTVTGEVMRSAAQFKSFGLAVLALQGGRIAREIGAGQPGALRHAAGLMITATLLGAAAMALKDMRDGRDPRKWLDEKTWLDPAHWGAAFLQAGGLGIYGDFLTSEVNRFGGGIEGTAAGPLVGRAGNMLAVTAEIKAAMEGKRTNFAKWGTDQLRRNVPFVNHWATSKLYQAAVMDALQQWADPQAAAAFRRAMNKRQKDYGQKYYWPIGKPLPERAPDLSRIFATR